MDATPGLKVRRFDSVDAMRKSVRRDQVDAGLVIPAGYDAGLRGVAVVSVTLYIDQTAESATALRTAVNTAIGRQAGEVGAVRFTRQVVPSPPSFDTALQTAVSTASAVPALVVDVQSTEANGFRSLTVAEYATAGELILFVFLIALVSAGELVDTRRLGISRRMLVSPATPRQVIVGEGLNRFLTAALQALVIAGVTALVFQLSWGNPIGVGLVISVFALVSVGAGLLMGTIARTTEQATSLGPVVGIALGMLGGCMWPLEVVPSQLRTIGHFTPHAGALDGLIRLMGEGRGPADVIGPVSMLLAFAALLVPIAAWRLKHSIVR